MKVSRVLRKSHITDSSAVVLLATLALTASPSMSQVESGTSGGGSGAQVGQSGGSPGSTGMEDSDITYSKQVDQSAKQGAKSLPYIGSLIDQGMHYNRKERYIDAERSLSKALKIIDQGALRPTVGSTSEGPPTIEHNANGTVAAKINKPPTPYEDTLGHLLPALITAETGCKHWQPAEVHVKRLIQMAQTNRIIQVPNLMFAYNQYAELLQKQHRDKEAQIYKNKADEINSSIKGL